MHKGGEAIGVFDSGFGGLTVVRSILERLPGESIVYLGDTARLPYGTKSAVTVVRYARACADILLQRGIKALVVACNTASAFALETLRESLDVPVIGVVDPGARSAIACTRNGRIGIIGTQGTMDSGEYEQAILSVAPETEVFCKPCPLFVPLAEEGWITGPVPEGVAETYLNEFMAHDIDTLLLGCTHYPLLAEVIQRTLGEGITVVDSAEATSAAVADLLDGMGMRAADGTEPVYRFLVSDAPETFVSRGRQFLGRDISNVEWVDF